MFYTYFWVIEYCYDIIYCIFVHFSPKKCYINVISNMAAESSIFIFFDAASYSRIYVWHMFYTYFGGVEPNYSISFRVEGHLRSINAISMSIQGQTLKLLIYASVAYVSYLIWVHKTQLYHNR